MGQLDRRSLILGVAAAAAAEILPGARSDSHESKLRYVESALSATDLENQKNRAIASLRKSIPTVPKLRYLNEHAKHLEHESQMYLPDAGEIRRVTSQDAAAADLKALVDTLKENQTGLFIFADVDERDGKKEHFQRLYVIRRNRDDAVRFEKGYCVSLAEQGFGNEKNSYKTPLGLHSVLSGKSGLYGEVVVAVKKQMQAFFERVGTRWFARSFGETVGDPKQQRELDRAEVVTDRYTIDEQRGIHIHGTNRSGRWDETLKKWITFLGGRRRSGGCIRMSNVDVRDLGLSGYIWFPTSVHPRKTAKKQPGKKTPNDGTLVMIHATGAARHGIAADSSEEYGNDYPKRRVLPEETATNEPIVPPDAPKPDTPKKFTPPPRRKLPEDK